MTYFWNIKKLALTGLVVFAVFPALFLSSVLAQAATVDVRVVDVQSMPIVGATVSVLQSIYSEITDTNGLVAMKNTLPNATFVISKAGFDDEILVLSNNNYSVPVVLKLSANIMRISGKIIDAAGAPIKDADIVASPENTLLAQTDATGAFLIDLDVSKNSHINIRHVDYLPVLFSVSSLSTNVSQTTTGDITLQEDTNIKSFTVKVVNEQGRPVQLNSGTPPKQSFDEIFVTKERSPDGAGKDSNWGNIDPSARISTGAGPGWYVVAGKSGYRIAGNFLEFRKKGYQKAYLYLKDPSMNDGATYDVILKTEKIENIYIKKKFLPLDGIGLDPIIQKNILLDAANDFDPEKNLGSNEYAVQQTFFKRILPRVYRIIGAIGIMYISIVGIGYIFSNGESDKITKNKDAAIWIAVGLMVVSLAEFVGFSILNPDKDILGGETLPSMQAKSYQIIRYIEYIGGGIFLLNGVLAGYSIIFSTNEEVATNQKKFMINFVLGVLFILSAEIIIRIASNYDGVDTTLNIAIGEVGSIINLILTFLAGASGFMLVLASLYYVTNFGNEEQTGRAKKIIIGCISGLVIAFSSFVLSQFLII